MEHALYINNNNDLKLFSEKFQRLYFGTEFCEYLLPKKNDLKKVISFCKEKKVPLTFITPWCTEKGIKVLKELFSLLPQKTEIVFNDYGVYQFFKQYNFIFVLGRLLVSTKRDPRFNFDSKFKKYFKLSNINNSEFQRFLLEKNINRIELDNTVQGYSFKLFKKISTSLYYPYVYISTSRKCLFEDCPDIMNYSKKKEKKEKQDDFLCNNNIVTAKLNNSDYQIIIKGNSQFYKNNKIPLNLKSLNINRLVFIPKL